MSNPSLGENVAVPAESSGERPHRHAIERASRRTRLDNLIYALASTRDRMSEDPVATMPHNNTTIVEWPNENQRPTNAAGFPE